MLGWDGDWRPHNFFGLVFGPFPSINWAVFRQYAIRFGVVILRSYSLKESANRVARANHSEESSSSLLARLVDVNYFHTDNCLASDKYTTIIRAEINLILR